MREREERGRQREREREMGRVRGREDSKGGKMRGGREERRKGGRVSERERGKKREGGRKDTREEHRHFYCMFIEYNDKDDIIQYNQTCGSSAIYSDSTMFTTQSLNAGTYEYLNQATNTSMQLHTPDAVPPTRRVCSP